MDILHYIFGDIVLEDSRSGKIVVVSHCILNVHSLEDGLAIYPGMEEDIIKILMEKSVGIYQIPCPETYIMGIFRQPLLKHPYDKPQIREKFRRLAMEIVDQLRWYKKKGYEIIAVLGAEGSPTCGINKVGRWKDPVKKGRFPDDVIFVEGMGVFMEEFKKLLEEEGINPMWIGIPGKSLRSLDPSIFEETLDKLKKLL